MIYPLLLGRDWNMSRIVRNIILKSIKNARQKNPNWDNEYLGRDIKEYLSLVNYILKLIKVKT